MSAEWNHDQILQLIEYYKQKPVIWDPSHNYYHVKNKKNDAWHEIAARFQCDIDCVKSKMASLLSSYRREKAKMIKLNGNGKRRDEGYESNWFAFKSFSFLSDKYKPRESYDTDHNAELANSNCQIKNEITEELTITPDIIPDSHKYIAETISPEEESDIKRLRLDGHEIKSMLTCEPERDECTSFGEHVGFRLRKLNNHARAVTIRKISNILCKADIGCYE